MSFLVLVIIRSRKFSPHISLNKPFKVKFVFGLLHFVTTHDGDYPSSEVVSCTGRLIIRYTVHPRVFLC